MVDDANSITTMVVVVGGDGGGEWLAMVTE